MVALVALLISAWRKLLPERENPGIGVTIQLMERSWRINEPLILYL